jgi:hypothetical protein
MRAFLSTINAQPFSFHQRALYESAFQLDMPAPRRKCQTASAPLAKKPICPMKSVTV